VPRHARPTTVFPIVLRELDVVAVSDVTPGMRRITLGGEQLGAVTDAEGRRHGALASPGFDDSFRLFFPHPGTRDVVLPTVRQGRMEFPTDPRPLHRVYSVRRFDAERRLLEVDFVNHGIGVATTWATRARPGDRVHIIGPTTSAGWPDGFDSWLVAGDDTALPAIARLLDDAPEGLRAQVFIEIADDAHRQPLRKLRNVEVTWLSRGGADAAESTLLLDAVRGADRPDGETFAWLAGEQSVVRDLRRHLIDDRALDKASIDFTGYWKREKVVALGADAAVPDPEKNTTAYERFHELAELAPPLAIRVAIELGIGDLISRGVTTTAELARRTGSDERALGKLLRFLRAIDLLAEPVAGHFALTETGEYLADEHWIEELHPAGVWGRQDAGLLGLAASVRTGRSSYASVTGRDFGYVRSDPAYERELLERTAEGANYIAPALAQLPSFDGARRVVIRSHGAGTEARELTAAHPELQVVISAPRRILDWLRRDVTSSVRDAGQRARISFVEESDLAPGRNADVVLLVHPLDGLDDRESADLLRAAAKVLTPSGRVLLVEHTLDAETLDEHDATADLTALTRDGTGLRTDVELDAVIGAAGMHLQERTVIGWGVVVRELAASPVPVAPTRE
jgi:NADPH-dependent ferric siderophore reductase